MNKTEMAMIYFEKLHGFNNNQPMLVREKAEASGFSCPADYCCYKRCGSKQVEGIDDFGLDKFRWA